MVIPRNDQKVVNASLALPRRGVLAVALLVVFGVVLGVAPGARGQERGGGKVEGDGPVRIRVVTSIAPLAGLVKPMLESAKIAASIETIVPPGVSEHGYEAPPSKLEALAKADVVVIVGLGMEPQVEKFLKDRPNPRRRVVIAAEAAGVGGIKLGHDEHAHEGHDHEHGEGCNHGHVDPHVWLDPALVEKIVPEIGKALRAALADDGAAVTRLRKAELELIVRVREVDAEYQRALAEKNTKTRTIVVGHDAWGYIEERYGLEAAAIKGLTASEPTPSSLENAMKAIKEHGARAVLVEPQLSRQAGEKIARATGVPVRVIDPLGDGDWFAMMRGNLKEFAFAVGAEEAPADPKK